MKLVFKLGDTKIKIPYEGIFDNYMDKDKMIKAVLDIYKNLGYSFAPILPDYDPNLIKEVYEKAFSNYIKYYKDINDVFSKYANANNGNTSNNENILPANGHDIYNYVARYGMANFQIQAILKFDGRIDFNKLSRAVRLSVDAEPVFGCRFVEDEPPYWKRIDDIDNVTFCLMEETNNIDEAVQRYIDSPLDMDNDPMVKIKLIRSERYDALGIKINHACCDGTGVKEYIQLLSDIYSCIDHENGIFVPKPRIRNRKDQDRLFNALNITDLNAAFIPGSEILLPTWPFPWKKEVSNDIHIEVCRISEEQFSYIEKYAKLMKATVNDLILTAFYRAMLDMGEPIYGYPMEIPITVDLRRYLSDHKTEAIRNFSGSVNTRLSMIKNEPFDETLSRIKTVTNEIKKGYPGLQSAIGLERLEKMSFQETLAYYQVGSEVTERASHCSFYCGDKCVPTLSNLGFITKYLMKFGRNIITDAYIVPPVVRAPGLLVMVSTYNNILTLSMGYYHSTISKNDAERLLNKIKIELINGTDYNHKGNLTS
ncbi:MAG: condensation domain-containing protein [Bacillota bacterium]|nr:condensation domain-containing protein [Bacillota bacterium]